MVSPNKSGRMEKSFHFGEGKRNYEERKSFFPFFIRRDSFFIIRAETSGFGCRRGTPAECLSAWLAEAEGASYHQVCSIGDGSIHVVVLGLIV